MGDLYIVLGIMAFMIVSFMLGKWPSGLTTMTCCALLVLSGFYSVPQAFSGLANQNVIMVAGMFVLSHAFEKTSLLYALREKLTKMKDARGLFLILLLFGMVIVFAQFLPTTGNMVIMVMFLMSLDNTGDITPSRMLIPILAMISIWGTKIPVGLGSSSYAMYNAMYQGLGNTEGMLLGMIDMFKVSIVPCLLMTIYSIFAYKLIPHKDLDVNNLKVNDKREAISRRDETIIYIVFSVVLVSLFMNKVLGNIMYVMPVVGVLVLGYTKTLKIKEITNQLSGDPVWMLAGVLVMANALGDSGAAQYIGNGILKLLGGKPDGIAVLFLFAVVTVVMTTFMSNSATRNVLVPVAASTALAAGWDPRGIVLIIAFCANVAIAFPSGSPACGIAYAAGGYALRSTFKFTVPFIVLSVISVVVSANIFFPIYG